MITNQEIKHLSNLVRIELNEEQVEEFQEKLKEILKYIEQLQKIDTQNISTADGGTQNLQNVWREDKAINNKISKQLIDMVPETENGQIKTKSIF